MPFGLQDPDDLANSIDGVGGLPGFSRSGPRCGAEVFPGRWEPRPAVRRNSETVLDRVLPRNGFWCVISSCLMPHRWSEGFRFADLAGLYL